MPWCVRALEARYRQQADEAMSEASAAKDFAAQRAKELQAASERAEVRGQGF